MKKVIGILCVLSLIILLKYYFGDYLVKYKVGGFDVIEEVKGNDTFIKIKYNDNSFLYKFNLKRRLIKNRIKSVELKEKDGTICIKPIIKNLETYFLCSNNKELSTLNAYQKDEEIKFTEDIEFNEVLSNNEYIYIWKYDGFYVFNKELSTINIFNSDRYSNDLMYAFDKYILFPGYGNEYLFSNFYLLDMSTGKYKVLETKYSINYDSYYVGNNKNNIYLFDNKNNKLYEINYKKLEVKLVGDEMKGFIKYDKNKKKKAKLSEYTIDKITFFKKNNSFLSVNKNYFSFDGKTWIKYFYDEDIVVVGTIKDNIYFIYEDNLYKYNNSKVSLVVHYFEYNFNKNNITFYYNK